MCNDAHAKVRAFHDYHAGYSANEFRQILAQMRHEANVLPVPYNRGR